MTKTTSKVKVACLECGKKFSTASLDPQCPKCGGVDIDVRDDPVAAALERIDAKLAAAVSRKLGVAATLDHYIPATFAGGPVTPVFAVPATVAATARALGLTVIVR